MVTSIVLPAKPQTLDEIAAYKTDVAARLGTAQAELNRLRDRAPSDDRRPAIREAVDVVDDLLDAQRFAEAREAELRQQELDAELERAKHRAGALQRELVTTEESYSAARLTFESAASELSRVRHQYDLALDAARSLEGMRHRRAAENPILTGSQLDAILASAQRSGRSGHSTAPAVTVLQQRLIGVGFVDLERLDRHLRAGGLEAQHELQRRLDALPVDGAEQL